MSVLGVARRDLKSARRSRALWAFGTLLALLVGVVAFGYQGYQVSALRTVQQLFNTLTILLAALLPIVALVASYMAIAGERESGGIKFLLGLPNTRRDVFLGKLLSRLVVVWTGIAFLFAAAASLAVARNGVLPAGMVAGLFALSLLYAGVFVAVAVALSAAVASKSRAIATAVGAYFALVILYVIPGIRITTVVRWVHTTVLGMEPNLSLYNAITFTSPLVAFRKAANLVRPEEFQREVFRRAPDAGELPAYLGDEMGVVVLALWVVLPLAVGYVRFQRSDLE